MTTAPAAQDPQPARINPIRAGLLCRCPSCAGGRLFAGFLRVTDLCASCGYDYRRLNTGDGAAVFVMQAAGTPVVFGALYIQFAYGPPVWALAATALPLVAALSLGLMRPAKGLMVALQVREETGCG